MKAVVYTNPGAYEVQDIPTPAVTRPDQVRVKIDMAGICGSDMLILRGTHSAKTGVVLGHEFTGIVDQVGSAVTHLTVGERVVLAPDVPCGSCEQCRAGRENLCAQMVSWGEMVDGGFAEYCVAPGLACHRVKKDLPPAAAVYAEPLACVLNGVQLAALPLGGTALILGCGPAGLLYIKCFQAAGAGMVLAAGHGAVRRSAAEKNGALLAPEDTAVEEYVARMTGGRGVDVVVDAVGSLLPTAVKCAKRGGKIILFGINTAARTEIFPAEIVLSGLTVQGAYVADHTFPAAIRMLEQGVIDVSDLTSHIFPLQEIGRGIDAICRRKAMKVLLRCGAGDS